MSNAIIIKGGKINLKLEYNNFKESEVKKLKEAAVHAHQAINSKEFENFVLNFSYSYKSCTGRFWNKRCRQVTVENFKENKNKTKKEIYDHLMTGEEVLRPGKDQKINIDLILDKRNKRGVLGYTYPNSTSQWIYNSFFKNGTPNEIAGNIIHEWCHKMGYTHAHKFNATRQYTVPYAVGYFVRDYKIQG